MNVYIVMIGSMPVSAFNSREEALRDARRFSGNAIVRTLSIGRPA